MKVLLTILSAVLLFTLSACGGSSGGSGSSKSPNQSQTNKTTKNSNTSNSDTKSNNATSNSSSSSSIQSPSSNNKKVPSDNINGVWKATGKQDGVSSTWYFNKGNLVVNYVNNYSYAVSKNKDSHGYTVVTIKNSEGKQQHALLLKKNGSNYIGITAEGDAYNKYLTDGTVPTGQPIEFVYKKYAWGSMNEAINFWEKTYKNSNNAISKDITWNNYRRDLWSLVKNGTSGNTITLHFTNISGSGGSYDQLVKNDGNTVITTYDGNTSYPKNPSMRYTVRNKDYKVIKTEELWKQK